MGCEDLARGTLLDRAQIALVRVDRDGHNRRASTPE
jgi:hypothetical protein